MFPVTLVLVDVDECFRDLGREAAIGTRYENHLFDRSNPCLE